MNNMNNINNSFFSVLVLAYFIIYGNIELLFFILNKAYRAYRAFTEKDESDKIKSVDDSEKENNRDNKYENKYLAEIRKMNKEYEFTYNELKYESDNSKLIYNKLKDLLEKSIVEATNELEKSITSQEPNIEIKQKLQEKLNELNDQLKNESELKDKSNKQARQETINKHLEKLNSCYIIEKTPLGNVLMIYDASKESFKYYSDSTIPYRYLETVGRKYVKTFLCRPVFIDMEEELRICEERWNKEQKEKEKEESENRLNCDNNKSETSSNNVQKKKNVFAKFKSYNKDAQYGHVNTGAPPKNSVPNVNTKLTEAQENEKVLLKEKANRYTYDGKFANFNFLKKVERKVVDKKYGTSYADFKRMYKSNN
jgi:hypothetical protein